MNVKCAAKLLHTALCTTKMVDVDAGAVVGAAGGETRYFTNGRGEQLFCR